MSYSVDAWGQPFPLPVPQPVVVPRPGPPFPWFQNTGTDTQLGGWFTQFTIPRSPPRLPVGVPTPRAYTPAAPATILPPLTWFSPFTTIRVQPKGLGPSLKPFTTGSIGASQPEAVHVQWFVPWRFPIISPALPRASVNAGTAGLPPATGTVYTLSASPGSFKIGGSAGFFEVKQPPFPNFDWSVSYSFSPIQNAVVAVVAYEPNNFIMLVVFQNGSAQLYQQISYAQMNTLVQMVQSGKDPTFYLSGLIPL